MKHTLAAFIQSGAAGNARSDRPLHGRPRRDAARPRHAWHRLLRREGA